MVVKKLKIDIEGDGVEVIVKISMNSKGLFSADVPLHLRSATHKVVSGEPSLNAAINKVYSIVKEYKSLTTTQVILIDFKRENTPFLNSGVSMSLNYAIANKVQFGKNVDYRLISRGLDGSFYETGNNLPMNLAHSSSREGVVAGKSLEIDFSEEKIKTIPLKRIRPIRANRIGRGDRKHNPNHHNMNLITALEISNNYPIGDILITATQHKATGKWTSQMYRLRDGDIHKLMLSFDISDTFAGWNSEQEAKAEMHKMAMLAIYHFRRLVVITPLSRLDNLQAVYNNLKENSAVLKLRWIIVVDEKLDHEFKRIGEEVPSTDRLLVEVIKAKPGTNSVGGYNHRNVALDLLSGEQDEWVYFLDDDNILHPKLLPFLIENDVFNTCGGIVVAQQMKNSNIRLDVQPDKIKVCHVDTASVVLSMALIGQARFLEGHYVADGYFIQSLYENNQNKFALHNIPLCYYNYLVEETVKPKL